MNVRSASHAVSSGGSEPRFLFLEGQKVEYGLLRGRRRLSLRLDERGLVVGAPHAMPLHEIERFLHRHRHWILEGLARWRARRIVAIEDGLILPVLGRHAEVRLIVGRNQGYWEERGEGWTLWLARSARAQPDRLLRQALARRLLEYSAPRLIHHAEKLGVPAPRLRLMSARTRWGSYSRAGGVRLNWRLVHLPESLVDYVIAHEVAHVREMNHGPRFWALVASLIPDWRTRRAEIRRAGERLPWWGDAR
ncbi:MAG: M48 family metallopeptidase [Rhodocyclaceae bacterium]|nr:M48 family metallopeptidase [Rhodocyclaceae bacterium]